MRGSRSVLLAALALVVVGVIAVVARDDGGTSAQSALVGSTTSTSARTEVLGVVVDQTTTTVTPTPATTATSAVTTTTAARLGRVWGYSYPSDSDQQTTVALMQGDTTVMQMKTDGEGLYDFPKVAPGTYTLRRTTGDVAPKCATTTTAGEQPACVAGRSESMGPEITLSPGGEVRADIF